MVCEPMSETGKQARRRYVRKPRGAAPGAVVLQRAQTVFARPTAAAIRAIRDRS